MYHPWNYFTPSSLTFLLRFKQGFNANYIVNAKKIKSTKDLMKNFVCSDINISEGMDGIAFQGSTVKK